MDSVNDKYSIKNLLFTKAIPNYVIPVPTTGHKVFACNDCGDKFLLQSSHEFHTNRKSVKISYFCRYCNGLKIFYNRCNLLSHIRSHSFKTATINVGDLRIDPLPLKFYNRRTLKTAGSAGLNFGALVDVSGLGDVSAPVDVSEQANENVHANVNAHVNVSSPANESAQANTNSPTQGSSPTTSREQISEDNTDQRINTQKKNYCPECDEEISNCDSSLVEKRAKHYMQFTNETLTCPFCMFTVPTSCALSTHLRIHFKVPPYLCPECGGHLSNFHYPFDHKCEGFMMMRATARLKCPAPNCQPFHPNDLKEHIKSKHLRAVFKCPSCYLACFDETIMTNHLRIHQQDFKFPVCPKSITFYQCDLCPGKLILQNQVDTHSKRAHSASCNTIYTCWVCSKAFKDMFSLASHHLSSHEIENYVRKCLDKVLNFQSKPSGKKKVYRVVKRCDQCKRSFSYKCQFEQINKLPNECPYKCTVSSGRKSPQNKLLTCYICKYDMSQDWEEIKKHFKEFHPAHRCVDLKVVLPKINIEKYLPVKSQNSMKNLSKRFKKKHASKKEVVAVDSDSSNKQSKTNPIASGEIVCKLCNFGCENKDILKKHLLIHRDSCMAYQCMECGQCFVVKPSFSKHLIIEHNISNIEDYINENQCYNENALMKYQDNPEINEPLRENQCKICREQFENSDDLEKHFRVHGMAFLMKNNCNKTNSP